MPKRIVMKTFRLVPLVLAGFCGYLHTVINRRFDEMGDLMAVGSDSSSNHLDAPAPPLSSKPRTSKATPRNKQSAIEENKQEEEKEDVVLPSQRIDMGKLLGPAADGNEKDATFEWKPPKDNVRILANSDEYQQMLLHYTMNLLPNHRDPTASKGNEGTTTKTADEAEDDLNNPKPYPYHEIDIIVPASGQDERLGLFAQRLGVALSNFNDWYETERKPAVLRKITQEQDLGAALTAEDNAEQDANPKPNDYDLSLQFRLLITRYPQDEQKTPADFDALLEDLSSKTTLPKEQIKLVRVGRQDDESEEDDDQDDSFALKFNRAHARNVLHQNACHQDDCIVTAFDVDMQVLPIFFHRALLSVTPHVKAYFPIVFSEYNPATVQMVQDFLRPPDKSATTNDNMDTINDNGEVQEDQDPMLQPFSRHRGLWRDFGYGMYVLAGSDVKRFRFNEEHQGWGHEDNDFYKLVHNNMRVDRQREHGLIHSWHSKNCDPGKDIITKEQWIDCLNSRDVLEGSALGLLLRPALPVYNKEDFPGLPKDMESLPPALPADGPPEYINKKMVYPGKSKQEEEEGDEEKESEKDASKQKEEQAAALDGQDDDDQSEGDDDQVDSEQEPRGKKKAKPAGSGKSLTATLKNAARSPDMQQQQELPQEGEVEKDAAADNQGQEEEEKDERDSQEALRLGKLEEEERRRKLKEQARAKA